MKGRVPEGTKLSYAQKFSRLRERLKDPKWRRSRTRVLTAGRRKM